MIRLYTQLETVLFRSVLLSANASWLASATCHAYTALELAVVFLTAI